VEETQDYLHLLTTPCREEITMTILKTKVFTKKGCAILILILLCTVSLLNFNCFALDPPPLTPLDEFFVANSSGIPPLPEDWQLIVDGAVTTPLSLTLEELVGYPSETRIATLECIGNPFSYLILIGNTLWTGVPLRTIIEETGPLSEAQSIAFHCLDGYKVQFSLDDIMQRDDDLLAYRMNGELLPPEQGSPLRLVLPGDMGPVDRAYGNYHCSTGNQFFSFTPPCPDLHTPRWRNACGGNPYHYWYGGCW
jgi:hypothetical protein